MRNIETHPEGFNALRRMFNEVQDPLMQAAAEGFQQPQPTTTNTAASAPTTGTPNTAPLPNPWARGAAAPATPAASASPFASLFGAAPAAGTPQPPASNPFAGLDQMPGMAGMGGMAGMPGMLDPQQALQMLQNPFVQNMMQQMAQNPQMFQLMIQSNPMLRQMMESNPFVAQMMNDPAALQQMLNPQAIQAALQFASMMPQGFGAPPAAPTAATPNPAAPANPPQNPFNFGSMWGPFMGGAGAPAATAANTQPPEVRWATELVKLEEMGFYDRTANIAALQASNGNVHAAVERLLANL